MNSVMVIVIENRICDFPFKNLDKAVCISIFFWKESNYTPSYD